MKKELYQEAIKETNRFVILTDNNEILKVFNTPEDAKEYSQARMKRTLFNKIDLYITTGIPVRTIDGMTCRDDIKPYKTLHIGKEW